MTTDDLVDSVAHRNWIGVAAFVVAILVRICKSDTKIPIDIPPRLRIWLALALGAVSGVLDHAAQGTPWGAAIIGGFVSAAIASVGHDAIVDSIRGGRELIVPGLIIPGAPPSPGKPPSIPPRKDTTE